MKDNGTNREIDRRTFVKGAALATGAIAAGALAGCASGAPANSGATSSSASADTSSSTGQQAKTRAWSSGATAAGEGVPKVYFTPDVSPAGLVAIYEAIGRAAHGNVAVKVSTGEPGGHNFLQPELISDLVKTVDGTIVECNTVNWGGRRGDTQEHMKVAEEHGFTAIAPVEIMDADGDVVLPVADGKHLDVDYVGKGFMDYDYVIDLAHFKGHGQAGFGGVIKNASIGIASARGKSYIHSGGTQLTGFGSPSQEIFLESLAEATSAVADHMGEDIIYIDVMNNLSVDCDCDSHPAAPSMADIGILGSTDPVALDRACVDLVYAAEDGGDLVERMESRNGTHVLDYAEQIGLGSQAYELVEI